MKNVLLALVSCLFFSANLSAHEYWFEPERFFLNANETTPVHLFVGDGLLKDREEREFQLSKTTSFELFSDVKTLDLRTLIAENAKPVYTFSGAKAGNYLLSMERNWSFITIDAQKFEDYLREDGIDYIIAERDKRGERQKEGRERYSRFIKTLLQVGDKHDDTFRKRVGLKLEIVPLENPYAKKVGDSLAFRILFDGKPLANRTVFADNRDAPTQKLTTDKQGRIDIRIDHDGLWLVRLVLMRRATGDLEKADWESFWSAFTFGVR